jgi:hypothetical protein
MIIIKILNYHSVYFSISILTKQTADEGAEPCKGAQKGSLLGKRASLLTSRASLGGGMLGMRGRSFASHAIILLNIIY